MCVRVRAHMCVLICVSSCVLCLCIFMNMYTSTYIFTYMKSACNVHVLSIVPPVLLTSYTVPPSLNSLG